MAVIKDLGAVTAYASAVEGGYTGTKAEFETLMASYASVAEEAAESAESASQSATQAGASAQTATTKASEASQSATQAGTKASEASTSATTASTKASEASASATSAQTAQGLAESAKDAAIDAKTDAENARDLAQQYAESIDPEKIYSAYPTDTASGSVASFADGADDIPMKSVKVAIEPAQSGSGDPSPDNVRPISGWTGVQVSHSGADRTNPTTYPITFPSETGTVYGGELDVTKGVLTVDRAIADLGTLTWNMRTNVSYGEYFWGDVYALGIKYEGGYTQTAYNALCSHYSVASRTQALQTDKMLCFDGSNTEVWQIQMKDSDYSDAAAFKTAMSGVQLCYLLATPITYHLTPTEIKSLLGDNNVWADAGDVSAEYRADTKLYIEKLTQPEEDDMIADSNIVSGSYFMVGNSLYLATANIANGTAIVEGSNCTRKSLSEALNEINA